MKCECGAYATAVATDCPYRVCPFTDGRTLQGACPDMHLAESSTKQGARTRTARTPARSRRRYKSVQRLLGSSSSVTIASVICCCSLLLSVTQAKMHVNSGEQDPRLEASFVDF